MGSISKQNESRSAEIWRRNQLMLRWSWVTASLIALFWGIYYWWMGGAVPFVSDLTMWSHPELTLPYPLGVSRWWDILIGPICSIALIFVFTSRRVYKEDLVFSLSLCAAITYVSALVMGFLVSPNWGVTIGLTACILIMQGISEASGAIAGIGIGLTTCVASGLVFGLVPGLIAGAISCMGLCSILAGKFVFSSRPWIAILDWLMVR